MIRKKRDSNLDIQVVVATALLLVPSILLSHLVCKFDNGRFQPLSLSGYQLIVLLFESGEIVIKLCLVPENHKRFISFILYIPIHEQLGIR